MRFFDLLYLSFQNFKSRKSRVFLTVLGVSVAIGAILFLVGLGYGLQKTLLEKITTTESLLTLDIVPPEAKVLSLNDEMMAKIKKIENVEKVSPQAILSGQVFLAGLTSEVTLNIIYPDFFSLSGMTPQGGKAFGPQDREKAVINSSTAELFDLKPSETIGKKIKFTAFAPKEAGETSEIESFKVDKEFEIIGVIEEAGGNPAVYLNRDDLRGLEIREYQFAKVKVVSDKVMDQVREKLIGMGFSVSALSDTIAQANKIFGVMQIILGIFGVIALFVAAIGLINTMTITLLERTNEIGIMRAIGASPSDIKRLFLGESLIIGFLGGVGGILLGFLGSTGFNWLVNILARTLGGQTVNLFYFPPWFVVFIVLLSSLVGLIGGFFPSQRASKLNPLEALRYK